MVLVRGKWTRTFIPPLVGRDAEAGHTRAGVAGVVELLLERELIDEGCGSVAGSCMEKFW